MAKPRFEYEYHKEGDVIIGGLISAHSYSQYTDRFTFGHAGFASSPGGYVCESLDFEEYKNILVMILAVNRINKDPDLLPNITLGYHIFDTCNDPMNILGYATNILSGEKEAHNYHCKGRGEVAGFIGNSEFYSNQALAQLLSLYRYTQITYRAPDPRLSDGNMYPTLFRVTPEDGVRFAAIIKFLRHFGWNWVGIITSWDGSGDEESQELSKMMREHGICTDYIIKLIPNTVNDFRTSEFMSQSKAKVVIVCGTSIKNFYNFAWRLSSVAENITFIFPPSWIKLADLYYLKYTSLNHSFIFVWPREHKVNLDVYTNGVTFYSCLSDPLLEDIWVSYYSCLSPNPDKNLYFQEANNIHGNPCSDSRDVSTLLSSHTTHPSFIYTAVYVLAHALHRMFMKKNKSEQHGFQHRLYKYVRNVRYTDPDDGEIYFNEKREIPTDLILQSWISFNNAPPSYKTIATIQGPDYVPGRFPNMSDRVFWRKGKVPVSRCSDPCLPGSRKKFGSSIHKCCNECASCPEGEISSISDSENCMTCPDEEWPNEKKDRCVPRVVEFLSYTDDPIVGGFSAVSILSCLLTGLILRIFIHYQDTPIVKANNRDLSYLLLVSIMLSFLCVFLFLGHPVDVTCMLRVTSFGVIFSVAVSSLLAKSIMVCIAFKVTKPGNSWRKWMGPKLPNSIICVFSLVQVIICATWLSISPPFQDRDTHSYQGKIIIQCNEGSVIGFYSVLGYMGLLAAVSFIIAFLARTLPDSFNEAKYITFSMLVFCSVWIAMIPAYLSTRGKYMVAVEVFAIIASSSGLLGCIFFPKCYIILFRPDLNTKTVIH
ncbi:vomeronasal type-2 receptor 26-like [Rana temporaria]|uniref:vomeronasal type-2 receptor 26-like n=1 Tax=Rana temporaria TaxID=8407 RepID=UPI001AAD78B3|nr:vomeronasal type-2 receptor 26-like [Rana temporaria]